MRSGRARILKTLTVALMLATAALGQEARKLPAKELPFTPPRKWALVIGANDYGELGRLQYAASDAAAVAKTLRERFSFSPEAIELLTDAPDSVAKPDVETVTKTLDRLLADKRLNDGDLFIFYFSGHGVGTATGDYLLPTNATREDVEKVGLNVKDVVRRFVAAGLRNVLFIVDACRGGEKNNFGDDLRRLGREANIAVFLSCQPGTRSYEYPQFAHGAFTNFLLKALKSNAVQSPVTGALWATKVIDQVRQEVRDYTERDYPDRPQTPTGWSEQTMDVLLGAFPSPTQGRIQVADVQAEASKLNPEEFADALSLLGREVFVQHRYADAVEFWRTLDGIRRLGPLDRMNLSFALNFMGRTLEADNELAKLERGDPENVYTWIARVYNPSRKVTPQYRVEAARKIWSLTKADWAGFIVWAALQVYASDADTREFLKTFLAEGSVTPRMRRFLEGQEKANSADWAGAEAAWESTRSIPGDSPEDSLIDSSVYQALVMQGKTGALAAFLDARASSAAGESANWHLLRAALHKEMGEFDAMVESVKTALSKKLDDGDLLWAIRILGLRFDPLAPLFLKRAEEFPFSWKAMLAKTWATKTPNGESAIAQSLDEASKFCDDEFAVYYECLRFLDETLDETLELGRITKEKYTQLMVAYSAIMASEVDQFGYDGEAWLLFNKFALMAEKFEQILKLYDVYLGPQLATGTLDPNLRAPYLMAALAMGDRAKVEQVWKLGGFHPSDTVDIAWLRAMDEALYGDLAKAKAMIPSADTSAPLRAGARAFRAYLEVTEGKRPDLDALSAGHEEEYAAMQFVALAYVEQGNWEKAMPILERYAFQRQLGFFFLQARVVEVYFHRLLAEMRFDEANQVAYNVMISGYGNPLYRKIHFGGEANLAAFAGEIELDAREFEMAPDMLEAKLKLRIDATGAVSGEETVGGAIRPIRGSIDAFGNLRAELIAADRVWTMTGKVAPPRLYETLEPFKTGAQAFILLDPKGQARFLVGRPAGKTLEMRCLSRSTG